MNLSPLNNKLFAKVLEKRSALKVVATCVTNHLKLSLIEVVASLLSLFITVECMNKLLTIPLSLLLQQFLHSHFITTFIAAICVGVQNIA